MSRSTDEDPTTREQPVGRSAMVLGELDGQAMTDRPRIDSDGRSQEPRNEAPPDPRAVIEDLRHRLRVEEEKSLNAADAVLGARAAAAQAKAETQDVFYRLHVRETELAQLKELIAGQEVIPEPTPSSAARTLLASVKRAVQER